MEKNAVEIPMDLYDSQEEILVIIPLGGVTKESIEVYLESTSIVVKGTRKHPKIKDTLVPLQQDCFWGEFHKTIKLPQNVYFDKISTKVVDGNILMIVVPKIIIPEKLKLEIQS